MKKLIPVLVIIGSFFVVWKDTGGTLPEVNLSWLPYPIYSWLNDSGSEDTALQAAWREGRSDFQVRGTGMVTRILSDDNNGSRHQRFILTMHWGQTLLVAHNIDLAQRISDLQRGDAVEFYGEYEWNDEGGVIHWTHSDPAGRHEAGWLQHEGRTYQ